MQYHPKRLILGMAMLLVTSLVACGREIPPSVPVPTAPAISVTITQDTCPSLEVQSGMQVIWTNQDNREHIVQSENLADQDILFEFDPGVLQPGDSFVFTFSVPDRYTYRCSLDGVITGTITVQP